MTVNVKARGEDLVVASSSDPPDQSEPSARWDEGAERVGKVQVFSGPALKCFDSVK